MEKIFTVTPSNAVCHVHQTKYSYSNSTPSISGASSSSSSSVVNYNYTPLSIGRDESGGAWGASAVSPGIIVYRMSYTRKWYKMLLFCDFTPYVNMEITNIKLRITPSASLSSFPITVHKKADTSTSSPATTGSSVESTITTSSTFDIDVTSLGLPTYGYVVSRLSGDVVTAFSSFQVIITANVSGVTRVNVGGVWKEATPYVNVGGTWKEAVPYINAGGTWKEGS